MRLTVVGSSDAFNSAGRAHSCYWIDGDGAPPMMIDFGATALSAIKRLDLDPRTLGGIAFTHLHGDHVGGIPFLVIDGLYKCRRAAPIDVIGPPGTAGKIDALIAATYGDVKHLVPATRPQVRLIEPGQSASFLGRTITAFPAHHMEPPEVPLCLRVEGADGKRAAFSGDTAMCDGLFEAAKGADLLVAECSQMAPPAGRHCTWVEWTQAFGRVAAKRLLLTHLDDEVRAAAKDLAAQAPAHLGLTFAEDGMVIEL